MTKINLETAWREDWQSFISSDDKKRHWITDPEEIQKLLDEDIELKKGISKPSPYY